MSTEIRHYVDHGGAAQPEQVFAVTSVININRKS